MAGMVVGMLIGALVYDGENRWPLYVLTALGLVVGSVVGAVTKKS